MKNVRQSSTRNIAAQRQRRTILDAARAEFLRHGFERTTLTAIIKRSGGARRNIYSEFGDKQALFVAVIEDICDSNNEELNWDPNLNPEPREALLAFGRSLMNRIMRADTLALFRVLLGEVNRFPDLGATVYRKVPEIEVQRLAKYLRRKAADGTLTLANPDRAAWHFLEMLQGNVHLKALLHPHIKTGPQAIDTCISEAVDIFLNGAMPR